MGGPAEGDLPAALGAYRVIRRLATGGTSDVLLGRAQGPFGFERLVALKVLLPELRGDDRYSQMFLREAAAYARLSHPAVVRLYDFFADREQLVLVLEYIDGLPLHRLLAVLRRRGIVLTDDAAIFIGWRIFSAMAAAHAARDPRTGSASPVIHRDINPSNVLIPWDGHVKLTDFGMARVTGFGGGTRVGLMKGTYGYGAPEQVRGEAVTVRADLYAGCMMLWELLAGRKAILHEGGSEYQLVRSMIEPSFPALSALRPGLPVRVLDAIQRGLHPDPAQRAGDAEEICAVLHAAIDLQRGRESLVGALESARTSPDATASPRPSHPVTGLISPSPPQAFGPPAYRLAPAPSVEAVRPRGAPSRSIGAMWRGLRPAWIPVGAGVAVAACVIAVALSFAWTRARAPAQVPRPVRPAVLTAPPVSPIPPTRAPPVLPTTTPTSATAAADVPAVTGTLTVLVRGGHRVWIDDKVAGQSPASFPVSCGTHVVRIGRLGAPRRVEVPCGAEVLMR